jgi:hypothetical protein
MATNSSSHASRSGRSSRRRRTADPPVDEHEDWPARLPSHELLLAAVWSSGENVAEYVGDGWPRGQFILDHAVRDVRLGLDRGEDRSRLGPPPHSRVHRKRLCRPGPTGPSPALLVLITPPLGRSQAAPRALRPRKAKNRVASTQQARNDLLQPPIQRHHGTPVRSSERGRTLLR